MEVLNYEQKKKIYSEYFSLGYINGDFNTKCALIGLVNYLTEKIRSQKPGITNYQILYKINEKVNLPQEFIESLSIICDDFAYQTHEFPNYGIKDSEIAKNIKKILELYLPF